MKYINNGDYWIDEKGNKNSTLPLSVLGLDSSIIPVGGLPACNSSLKEVCLDDKGLYHLEEGPALIDKSGEEQYYWHGKRIL